MTDQPKNAQPGSDPSNSPEENASKQAGNLPEANAPLEMQDLVGTVLIRLNSQNPVERSAAAAHLTAFPEHGVAGMAALGRLAVQHPDLSVRQAALEALRSPSAAAFYRKSNLPIPFRMEVLRQIEQWLGSGIILNQQAHVLRARYGYDLQPPTPASLKPAPQPVVPAAPATPPAATAPRPSLMQILFSEVSIQIALYLGGFMVVAAALILAAIIEVGRLPILLGLTGICGLSAVLIRRRLPLPSFVIFIIFASLLPVDAAVLGDSLGLKGALSAGFWAIMMVGLAAVLVIGTLIYRSRLLSLLAPLALCAAGGFFGRVLGDHWETYLFLLALATLAGTLWAALLKRWNRVPSITPLVVVLQIQAALMLAATFFTTLGFFFELLEDLSYYQSSQGIETDSLVMLAFTWMTLALFYGLTDRLIWRFTALPFLAAGALLFVPWTLISGLPFSIPVTAGGMAFFGTLYALAGNFLSPRPEPLARRYGLPLLLSATGVLAWASLLGLAAETTAGFMVLVLTTAVFTGLHLQKRRTAAWIVALVAGLAAYLAFFSLPFARAWEIQAGFRMISAALLLLLPDLLPLPGEQIDPHWRLPARILGALVLCVGSLFLVVSSVVSIAEEWPEAARLFAVTALFMLIYALRRKSPRLGYFFTGFLSFAVLSWLIGGHYPQFTPPLLVLAAIFYLAGLGLHFSGVSPRWSEVMRYSGLVLAPLATMMPYQDSERLWVSLATLAAGVFFLAEVLLRRGGWLELVMDGLFSIGLLLLAWTYAPAKSQAGLSAAGMALVFSGFDLWFTNLFADQKNPAWLARRWIERAVGGFTALGSVMFLVGEPKLDPLYPALVFAIYVAFALLAAWGYQMPRLGYAAIAFLQLSVLYFLRFAGMHIAGGRQFLGPMIGLSALLYLLSFVVEREERQSQWVDVLRLGGLGSAMLLSISGPLQGGLSASLWVAVAASLFAIEAFRRRSVWWGFPTNGLYLLAYFILLFELKVEQPQYYSVGVAVLGILMHFLLVRAGSRTGAFITGLVSQFVLLGTTYIQMVATDQLGYFIMLFFQSLAVLVYGILIRSRSLVLAPVVFIVVGVLTVVLSVLSGIPTAIIIGCTGLFLLLLGILAVLMRERLSEASDRIGERLGGWRA